MADLPDNDRTQNDLSASEPKDPSGSSSAAPSDAQKPVEEKINDVPPEETPFFQPDEPLTGEDSGGVKDQIKPEEEFPAQPAPDFSPPAPSPPPAPPESVGKYPPDSLSSAPSQSAAESAPDSESKEPPLTPLAKPVSSLDSAEKPQEAQEEFKSDPDISQPLSFQTESDPAPPSQDEPEKTAPDSQAPADKPPKPSSPSSGKPVKKIFLFLLVVLLLSGFAWLVFRFVFPRLRGLPGGEVTLSYWGLWEPESVMAEVFAEWEKEHPDIRVEYRMNSPKEYRQRLQNALAKGEGPDIFRFHNTWTPMLKNELDPVPASIMDAAVFEQTFYPVAASSLRYGANYLGIPLEIDTLALFYNEDILTTAGVHPPRNWNDLRRLASQLTLKNESGQIQRSGAALGTAGNVRHWSDILGLMMLQNGADLSSPSNNLAEDALTFYTLFSTTDGVWNETLPESLLAFASGKAAMFFGFSWDVFEIKAINPNLNFKVVAAPQLSETEKVNWASFWAEGVSQESKNKEAAWEFLRFLSSPEIMEKLYHAESKLRLFGEPYSRKEMAGLIQSDPLASPFLDQAEKARTWYLCSRTFDNGLNDRMIQYFEDAVNAVNSGQTSTKALSTASQGVAQVLSQYGL